MVNLASFLKQVNDQSVEIFKGQKRILSFSQYLESFCAHPVRSGRSAPQYLLDVFDYFGTKQVQGIGGKVTRWNLFDAPWDKGREPLTAQEPIQAEIYRHVRRFAASGRADKLVLLHGPNGSAKSTAISLLARAMEHYSTLEEGAVFRFNWVFTERNESKGMGFSSSRDELPKETLAFIEENLVSCKLVSELREAPIFLVPSEQRRKLFDELIAANPGDTKLVERLRGPFLSEGRLSHKNKLIFDALMAAYRGDWLKVIRHVQVERYFISRRYKTGFSSIEPQQAVDAGARPTGMDHGVTLPPVLHGLQLIDLFGELVEGSGGIVEYSDILKRNLELNKYLLGTVERGELNLPGALATLNCVMLGTCNEKQLSAFKATPDFTSYKGRIELIRAPYLLQWSKEREIYDPFIDEIRETRHVAPHTAEVVALWAVLTRLRRPDPGEYPSDLAGVIRRLKPLDKARLYDSGTAPEGLSTEEKRLLRTNIRAMHEEFQDSNAEFENFVCSAYEGRRGASAREMKSIVAEVASDASRPFLSPLAVFDALEKLLRDKSVYDFLRLEPDEGYHDCEYFIEEVRNEYARWIAVEVYDSMGLIEETEYDRRVEDYFRSVRAYVSGEKVQNVRTGQYEEASEEIMHGLEKLMTLRESPDAFRKNLITKIAAFSLENPNTKIDYHEIFSELFHNLRDSYYKEKAKQLIQLGQYVLMHESEDKNLIPNYELPKVENTLKVMREKYGYNNDSAREAINLVLRSFQEKT